MLFQNDLLEDAFGILVSDIDFSPEELEELRGFTAGFDGDKACDTFAVLVAPHGSDGADESFIHRGGTPAPEIDNGTSVDEITVTIAKIVEHMLWNLQ
jgi:hypothetical protein